MGMELESKQANNIMDFLEKNNPELLDEIRNMRIYDGTLKVCNHYDITPPDDNDSVEESLCRINAILNNTLATR